MRPTYNLLNACLPPQMPTFSTTTTTYAPNPSHLQPPKLHTIKQTKPLPLRFEQQLSGICRSLTKRAPTKETIARHSLLLRCRNQWLPLPPRPFQPRPFPLIVIWWFLTLDFSLCSPSHPSSTSLNSILKTNDQNGGGATLAH